MYFLCYLSIHIYCLYYCLVTTYQFALLLGELRQLERSKRKEVDELNNLLSSKESAINKLKDSSLAVAAETKVTEERLNEQVCEFYLLGYIIPAM